MRKMRPGFHKSLASERKNQGGEEEEVKESELSKRIKKYLEENKKIIHIGKLTGNEMIIYTHVAKSKVDQMSPTPIDRIIEPVAK